MTTKELTNQNAQQAQKTQQEETRQMITPAVDILENDHEYLVVSDMPGAQANAVHVELNNGELTIRAPISNAAGVDLFSGGRAAYEYGRRFRVPSGVAGDKIAAKLTNGVLELRIPKEEARKPRQIQVRTA